MAIVSRERPIETMLRGQESRVIARGPTNRTVPTTTDKTHRFATTISGHLHVGNRVTCLPALSVLLVTLQTQETSLISCRSECCSENQSSSCNVVNAPVVLSSSCRSVVGRLLLPDRWTCAARFACTWWTWTGCRASLQVPPPDFVRGTRFRS